MKRQFESIGAIAFTGIPRVDNRLVIFYHLFQDRQNCPMFVNNDIVRPPPNNNLFIAIAPVYIFNLAFKEIVLLKPFTCLLIYRGLRPLLKE